jgi:hypothetical protein
MQREHVVPKLQAFSWRVSVNRVPAEVEERVIKLVEELEKLLADPHIGPHETASERPSL